MYICRARRALSNSSTNLENRATAVLLVAQYIYDILYILNIQDSGKGANLHRRAAVLLVSQTQDLDAAPLLPGFSNLNPYPIT